MATHKDDLVFNTCLFFIMLLI